MSSSCLRRSSDILGSSGHYLFADVRGNPGSWLNLVWRENMAVATTLVTSARSSHSFLRNLTTSSQRLKSLVLASFQHGRVSLRPLRVCNAFFTDKGFDASKVSWIISLFCFFAHYETPLYLTHGPLFRLVSWPVCFQAAKTFSKRLFHFVSKWLSMLCFVALFNLSLNRHILRWLYFVV